jgi:Ca2+-binding RTX toxin-like protein
LQLLLALVGAGALLTTFPAEALNVLGTSGPDILRGTKSSDWITGKRGADRLFGRQGNDILTGGPGTDYVHGGPGFDRLQLRDGERDRAVCGPGRDTVVADARDVASSDCETVLRPAPPVPPPPEPVAATSGTYKGVTQTGNFVFFDVLPSRRVRGWRVNDVRRRCDGPLTLYGPITVGSAYVEPIQRSGRFETEWDYPTTIVLDENGDKTRGQGHTKIVGMIDGPFAYGTVLATFEFELDGRVFRCTNSTETWSAHRLP